jgi:hypothetical protein
MRRPRVLTWHIHGNYLYYLSQANVDFYLPVRASGGEGYGGKGSTFGFVDNVHDVPVDEIHDLDVDCILYQTKRNYLEDGQEILSDEQRELPSIYLQHDPPWQHPTDERHWVDDPNTLLVHVTPFNQLMWDCGRTPTRVIDHGVIVPKGIRFTGELPRGVVVINNLATRGRMLGADVFEQARKAVPLDLVGMAADKLGGVGEIHPHKLAQFETRYRFFFNPIRYTSLGLAVCEAMMLGMPIVGLATTEMSMAVENGVSGYVDTNVPALIDRMKQLVDDPLLAKRLGEGARRYALDRFNIQRFASEWERTIAEVVGRAAPAARRRRPVALTEIES